MRRSRASDVGRPVIASVVMTCTSPIATVRAWLTGRLLEHGYDRERAAEILAASTIASAGTSIYVDFHEPPDPRALTFEFRGETITEVFGLDDGPRGHAAPTSGESRSPVSV